MAIASTLTSCWVTTCEDLLPKWNNEQKLNGIIKEKYLDRMNKGAPVLVLDGPNKEYSYSVILIDVLNVYNAVQPGDSVVKNRGESFVTIYRKGETIIIDPQCN